MFRRQTILLWGLLAGLWSGDPVALAADGLVHPACNFVQSTIPPPSGNADFFASANDAAVLPSAQTAVAPRAPGKPIPVDESNYDRYIVVVITAVLLAFAFVEKKPPKIPPAKIPELNELRLPAERTLAKEAATLKPAKQDVPAADQGIGRNIVVPVDFSPGSELAVRMALVWSKARDQVNLVYAYDLEKALPPENLTPLNLAAVHPALASVDTETARKWSQLPWVVVLPLAFQILERWAMNEFERLIQILEPVARAQVGFHLLHGDPVSQIVKLSEDVSAHLIVLVAHQHSLTDRLIAGSHADALLHGSRVPVLVVCEPVKSEPGLPQEILVTTDYSADSLPVFLVLKDLMHGAKPNITVLTVETAHEHHPKISVALDDLQEAFRVAGFNLRSLTIDAVDVEAGILDYVKAHKPQLIAMSSHGRLGFAELMHPSVAKAILHNAGVPVLVVHGRAMPTKKTVGSLSDLLRIITG